MKIIILLSCFIFLMGCQQDYDERLEGTWFSNKERTLAYLDEETAAHVSKQLLEDIDSGKLPFSEFLEKEGYSELLPEVGAELAEEGAMYAYLQDNLGDLGYKYEKNKIRVVLKSDLTFSSDPFKYELVAKTTHFLTIKLANGDEAMLVYEDNCYYHAGNVFREYFCKVG